MVYQLYKFHDLKGWGSCAMRNNISHIIKKMYFFKYVFSNPKAYVRQTGCIKMMRKELLTKLMNFKTNGAGVVLLGLY